MKCTAIDPPRVFEVGGPQPVEVRDSARIELDPDEQVTFVTGSGAEYDVVRKSWGFYAAPSLNSRLGRHSLRPALVRNSEDRFFLLLVELGCEEAFQSYLREQKIKLVCWMDHHDDLSRIEHCVAR